MAILSCHVSIKLPPKISDGQDFFGLGIDAGDVRPFLWRLHAKQHKQRLLTFVTPS